MDILKYPNSGEKMAREIRLDKGKMILRDDEVEGFLERVVTAFGNSGKADIPKKYIGRRVYIIVTKEDEK